MPGKHIVKSFDRDMDRLKEKLLEMGAAAGSQLSMTMETIATQDQGMARVIVAGDKKVNALQHEVDQLTVSLLALRQPMAFDLRVVIAGLKIAGDLERIADYSANIARHIFSLEALPSNRHIEAIRKMTATAHAMLEDVLDAFDRLDLAQANAVWHRDDEIDHTYRKLLTQLRTFMTEEPENVGACTSLLFVARCCERIGDHITNIAESVHYIVEGKPYCGNEPCPTPSGG